MFCPSWPTDFYSGGAPMEHRNGLSGLPKQPSGCLVQLQKEMHAASGGGSAINRCGE